MIIGSVTATAWSVTEQLALDGQSLTIEDVVGFARRGGTAALSPEAAERVNASRALRRELVEREIPIYGVTTGFGDSAHRQIAPERAPQLQRSIVLHLGAGTGPIASPEVTRATMLLRANCLAKGNSGVRAELIERLLLLLNHDILPLIPERGSCGASGDLVPLSYVASLIVGEQVEVALGDRVLDSREALAELELEPLELEAKEGLGLVNGTSFMSAFASFAVHDAERLALTSDLLTAIASEALLGNRGHFNAFLFEAKPHPGQAASAEIIREMLAESELTQDSEEIFAGQSLNGESLQPARPASPGQLLDPLRPPRQRRAARHARVAQPLGRDRDQLIRRQPALRRPGRRAQSGGNFYGSYIAQGMDALKIALANLCDLMDRQLELLVDEKFNAGLTPNLIPRFESDDPQAGSITASRGCSSPAHR